MLLGALWLVLGAPWELQVTPKNFESDSGALLNFFLSSSLSFFSLLHPPAASKWFFIFFWDLFFSSWSFSRSIFSSQDDPPTFKNIDFSWTSTNSEKSTFSIRPWSSERFGGRLGSFSVLLGASSGPVGLSWGLLGRSRWLPNYLKSGSGALLGFLLSSSLSFFSLLQSLAASK